MTSSTGARQGRDPQEPGIPNPVGAILGEVRTVGHRRVSFGLYRPLTDGTEFEELIRDLHALRLVMPPDAAFTHLTAALLRGWQVSKLPANLPVFAAVHSGTRRPRRPGLLFSRLVGDRPAEMRHGLPGEPAEEILLRVARDLGVMDLVIMIDSALQLGDIDVERMDRLLASRRPGVRALRAAWQASDGRAESGGESVLRMFHDALDIAVEPQAVLRDDTGRRVGRADLLVIGTREVHEYDGAHHRDGRQDQVDLRRERGLGTSYRRRGFTLDDLLNQPATVMHELDRVLGRRHEPARLRRWRALIAGSMYSDAARQRLVNRWQRAVGVVDWRSAA
ncbi:hypothetical protein NSZ01_01720 [Nocardioides szechwanensis]|uniref:Uncharacterized protein n=1 Tax=Nocardioides szechwanensis TaxID=1005944 RepID=A0A1G9X8A6_9ACTN|nr:hypothetical protein [Nocardioides szechwanensis]GEP32404.1 hypothetical protein NSZ01_01720 [Nocardioides szechwanensis]SDM92563.1 hypothetical protein SAMN05192576_1282 [Nocardioides szechwanensis]